MNPSSTPLSELVNRVVAAADAQCSTELGKDLRNAFHAISEYSDGDSVRELIAARLLDVSSCCGAGFLAVWLGAGAEHGAEPEAAGRHILNAMLKWAGTIETSPETDLENDSELNRESSGESADEYDYENEYENDYENDYEDEIEPDICGGLELLGQGLVAHLARSEHLLRYMSDQPNVIEELERIEHFSAGPMWVLELLRKRSGELVVIHVEARAGYRVAYKNLSNCFHMFTLLQIAMADTKLPGTRKVSKRLRAVASGEKQDDLSDEAWWHYGIGTCSEADLSSSIWGEAGLDSIVEVDGEQIVLLWPTTLESRQWGAGFFGPSIQASPPSVQVLRRLSDTEVAKWCERLELPAL